MLLILFVTLPVIILGQTFTEEEKLVVKSYLKHARSCSSNVDNVATKLYFTNCANGDPITVQTMRILDPSNVTNYPIDVSKKVVIQAISQNSGGTYPNLLVDVGVWYHGTVLGFNCGWHTIPTGGALNNMDGCKVVPNCPLKPGVINLHQQIDLTKFQWLLQILPKNAIKLEVRIKDAASKVKIACVRAEFKMK